MRFSISWCGHSRYLYVDDETLTSLQPLLVKVAAEPYETIAFAIPAKEIVDPEEDPEGTWENWDPDAKVYSCQFLFR